MWQNFAKKVFMVKPINPKIAIVASTYRPEITQELVNNCTDTLLENGIKSENIFVVYVPGSLEIPLAAKMIAKKKQYSAIICFGAIFKGKTYHFEQIANESVRGCMQVSYDYEIPVIYEVLTVYKAQDARERSRGKKDNRGIEGALCALQMIKTLKRL